MGLFDGVDVDWEQVEEFQTGLPEGKYEAVVSQVVTEQKESGLYLVIYYTVTSGRFQGKTHREFNRLVQGAPQNDSDVNAVKALKTRMLSLNVPAERMNTVDVDDIRGLEVSFNLVPQKNNPSYMQVRNLVVMQPAGAAPVLPPVLSTGGAPAAPPSGDNLFG